MATSHYTRPQRPAPRKNHSSHALSKSGKKSVRIHEEDVDEDIMAASFLQYCATCEKQIIVPSNAVLYCSEGCKRKDNNKTLSFSSDQSPPLTPLQTFAFDDGPVRDIVPQRSPTAASNPNRLSYSSASEDETMYSEDEQFKRPALNRQESEAERCLRQFHSSDAQGEHSTPRPRYNRSSTGLSMMSQAPSLSHSPTSTAGLSFPYTPSTTSRPLPPRTNPFSTSFKYSRSIDLVNPFAITPIVPTTAPSSLHYHNQDRRQSLKSGAGAQTSNGFAEGELLYEKMDMNSTPNGGQGSLKTLFKFNEMQAPPAAHKYARY